MASENVVKITEANFEVEVLKSHLPVFLEFFAAWCHPCHTVARLIDELATEYKGRIKVGRVDADSDRTLVARFKIETLPVCLMFREGHLIDAYPGRKSRRGYVAMIEGTLKLHA